MELPAIRRQAGNGGDGAQTGRGSTCAMRSSGRTGQSRRRGRTGALWRSGALALWRSGALALWRSGALALWRSGALALWRSGALALIVPQRVSGPSRPIHPAASLFPPTKPLQKKSETPSFAASAYARPNAASRTGSPPAMDCQPNPYATAGIRKSRKIEGIEGPESGPMRGAGRRRAGYGRIERKPLERLPGAVRRRRNTGCPIPLKLKVWVKKIQKKGKKICQAPANRVLEACFDRLHD